MVVNGQEKAIEKLSVEALVEHLSLPVDRIVVEVNGEIINPKCFGTHWLSGDEIVEIVSFVGGG